MDAFFDNILRNFENSWNKRSGGTAMEKDAQVDEWFEDGDQLSKKKDWYSEKAFQKKIDEYTNKCTNNEKCKALRAYIQEWLPHIRRRRAAFAAGKQGPRQIGNFKVNKNRIKMKRVANKNKGWFRWGKIKL